MRKSFYSVHCRYVDTHNEQRIFSTVRAARKWALWLKAQSCTAIVSLYHGEPGGELLERWGA